MEEIIIHPTAIVSPKAQIGKNTSIGAYSIIEDDVIIGENNEIRNNVVFANGARIGNNNRIHAFTVIATEPQDIKFKDEQTFSEIGDNNIIREFVTINRGTSATGKTVLGSNCMLMAYSHIAHDCRVGNNVIMANVSQLGGHVHIEDTATIGGAVKIHQFCHVGCHSMVGADVKLTKDVLPYALVGDNPPKIDGINLIGLKRRGFSPELIKEIQNFYKIILRSGMNNSDALKYYKEENKEISSEIQHCIEFIENSQRGIYR